MGWLARIVLPSAALIAGCAALVGIGEADTTDDDVLEGGTSPGADAGTRAGGEGGRAGEGGSGGGSDGGLPGDSGGDAAKDSAPACSKQPNDGPCADSGACCSGACAENHKCVGQCRAVTAGCTLGDTDDCCIGTYCSTEVGVKCRTCIANGANAESAQITGLPISQSCCSRNASFMSGQCIP